MSETETNATVDHVLVDTTIAAPVDALWDALKDPAKIYNWHGWDDPSLKDEIEFIYVQYGNYDDATKVLSFGEYEGVAYRFEVTPSGEGSRLRVVGAASADMAWDDVYKDVIEGWISFAQQLRFGLERHDIGPRRALYLGGSAKPGGTAPTEALGLTGLRDLPDGAPFSVDLPTGEHVEGQVWHRSKWQLGLTVPQWGDGLLIVTDKSVTDEAPDGRGMVVLTSYGLSDEEAGELEKRWRTWWDERFPTAQRPGCE